MNSVTPVGGSRPYAAPAAACAAETLLYLARSDEPLSLAALAREVNRSRSLTYRVLHELETLHLVDRGTDGRYWLGVGVLEVGGAFAARAQFSDSVGEVLRELSDATGETTNLAVLDGTDILYLQRHVGRNSVVTISYPGKRLPANCTALGKALLAELSNEDVRALLSESFPRITSNSIVSIEALLRELGYVREHGIAREDGETLLGRTCVGVAVDMPGQEGRGAISISAATEVFAEREEELVAALIRASDRLEMEAQGLLAMNA